MTSNEKFAALLDKYNFKNNAEVARILSIPNKKLDKNDVRRWRNGEVKLCEYKFLYFKQTLNRL
jgi:hypothetical protein